MNFLELVSAARSCRRFLESETLSKEFLKSLVDCARLSPSARNQQVLRYITISSPEMCTKLFSTMRFAAALKDWKGPHVGERPTGYIVILEPAKNTKLMDIDVGIAAQNIQLSATALGFGACMVMSFDTNTVSELLSVPEGLQPVMIIALGRPVETRVSDDIHLGDPQTYWRDNDNVHHVPKLILDDILIADF